jgi:hypothetical protein
MQARWIGVNGELERSTRRVFGIARRTKRKLLIVHKRSRLPAAKLPNRDGMPTAPARPPHCMVSAHCAVFSCRILANHTRLDRKTSAAPFPPLGVLHATALHESLNGRGTPLTAITWWASDPEAAREANDLPSVAQRKAHKLPHRRRQTAGRRRFGGRRRFR